MAHAVAFTVTGFVGVRIALGVFEASGTSAAVKSAATYYGLRDRSNLLGLGNITPTSARSPRRSRSRRLRCGSAGDRRSSSRVASDCCGWTVG